MHHSPYSFYRQKAYRYTFISIGKTMIEKVVDFTPTSYQNIVNMGFGDLLPDGSVDDTANSNNGDIIKVLSTVIQILVDFIAVQPRVKVIFTGSTEERTRLYQRILRTYYPDFSKQFMISGLVPVKQGYREVAFDPADNHHYLAFFIQKNN